MSSTNGWDVVGGMTEALLTSEVTNGFDNAVNSGLISNPITIGGLSVDLSTPAVTISADPDPDTGWESCVALAIDATVAGQTGTITIKVNVEELFLGVVRQSTYLSSDGTTGSGASCGALSGALPSSGATVMGWINLQSSAAQTLFSLVDGSTTLLAVSLEDSQPSLSYNGSSYTYSPGSYAPSFAIGSWHHVAIVLDPEANSGNPGAIFYLDGQPQGTAAIASLTALSGTFQVGIAAGDDAALNGSATGVSVWQSALSASQIQLMMNADLMNGDLPSGVTCIGYWQFDPGAAYNLMDSSVAITAQGGASLQSNSDPTSEMYLYFADDDESNIFYTSNTFSGTTQSTITSAITTRLTQVVEEGAKSFGSSSSTSTLSLDTIPSYLGFVTEASGDWTGPDQLFGLTMLGSALPPFIDDKSTFASDSTLQVPTADNLVVALSDVCMFTLIADKLNSSDSGWSATVSENPVQLTCTNVKFSKYDFSVVLSIVDGQGIKIDGTAKWGLSGGDTWDIGVSVIASFEVVGEQIQLSFSGLDVSVTANPSSSLVQAFEEAMLILEFSILYAPLALLCETLAALWRGFIYAKLYDAVDKKTSQTYSRSLSDAGNFTLDQIAFEDGVVVYGSLSPRGAIITGISPETGSPGDSVTISGQGFVDSSGASLLAEAEIGGQIVTLGTVGGTSQSGTAQVTVVSGGTGVPTGVKVKTSSGNWSNSYGSFVVTGTVAPSDVELVTTEGVAGDSIDITGSGFTGTTTVEFGTASATFTVSSDTSITAIVPNLAQAGVVTVTNNIGAAQSSNSFSLIDAPAITGVDPSEAAPGDSITIYGTSFITRDSSPMQALFSRNTGGTLKTSGVDVTLVSDTEATVAVPLGATPGYLYVSTAAGTSGGYSFTVNGAATPTVSGFSPTNGNLGTLVTVTGSSFSGASTVTIGGQSCSFSLASTSGDTTLSITVPTKASSGVISVTNSVGTGSSEETFYVVSKPTISSISPTSGEPETSVTISGSNFMDGGGDSVVTEVAIGLISSAFTVNSATKITATVPDGGVGIPGGITVTTGGGTATSSQSFTVLSLAEPSISSFSPSSGAASEKVTVTGESFTGTTSVTLGGTACIFTLSSDTSLTFYVPSMSAGTYAIEITNSKGSAIALTDFSVTTSASAQ
jgi:hypothetical protein